MHPVAAWRRLGKQSVGMQFVKNADGFVVGQGRSGRRAAGQLREALSQWRGDPLAGVPSEARALREVPRLEEMRLQALAGRPLHNAGLRVGWAGFLVWLARLVQGPSGPGQVPADLAADQALEVPQAKVAKVLAQQGYAADLPCRRDELAVRAERVGRSL